ncbi:TPA: DinI-like family protein [Citrobacter gillenii]|nr:DinI-like family protein [Citrobacter gillenii]
MKVGLPIDRTKEPPKSAVPMLERQQIKQFQNQFDGCCLFICREGSEELSVYGGEKEVKNKVEEIPLQTWESADDWFY